MPTTQPAPPSATDGPSSRIVWIVGGAILVVVLALVAAVTGLFSTNSSESTSQSTVVAGGPTPAVAEVNPVRIVGTPLATRTDDANDPAVGLAAPIVSGVAFDGSAVSAPTAGARTLMVFLAHWCPHCQREVPVLVDWMASGGAPADLQIVAVSTAVNTDRDNFPPSAWLIREGWTGGIISDDKDATAASTYGLDGFPYMVLVGADGNVIARTSGEKSVEQLNAFVAS
jgi:cytochrome c biogenesis protein CcmG, thiol:disulfide interchange protein DsbE